ncbi:MAG TPA: tetratricopeptide repeat protein [Dehalococcoidia bacterium]|nr:tetratricopeptide repeat protein [Dehalococcoidia bacterium]
MKEGIFKKEYTVEPMAVEDTTEDITDDKVLSVAPEGVELHLERGKEHYEAGRYAEALAEFDAILQVAPGHIETRILIRKAKEGLAAPEVETVEEGEEEAAGGKQRECVWVRLGMVSHRICTNNMDCVTCEFDQMMQEKMANPDADADVTLATLEGASGNERLCRYAIKGDVSYRLCSRVFQCATCEFAQMMEDELQKKLDRLAVRREAMRKRAESK